MIVCSRSTLRHAILVTLVLSTLLRVALPASVLAQTLPTLPQAFIDTTYASPSGKLITVNAGGDLQGALNAA